MSYELLRNLSIKLTKTKLYKLGKILATTKGDRNTLNNKIQISRVMGIESQIAIDRKSTSSNYNIHFRNETYLNSRSIELRSIAEKINIKGFITKKVKGWLLFTIVKGN